MSDLQIGLAVVGGVVLAAFVAHGAWATRKNTPKQAEAVEPVSGEGAGDTLPVVVNGQAAAFNLPSVPKRTLLDSLIDVIAPITLDGTVHAVSGEAAWAAMPVTRRAGTKPFAVEGLNQNTQLWEAPVPGQRYTAFQAGVQLANRSGALNEIEYSEFVVKTQAFADAINAAPEFPEMLEEVARARELDQFASAHDAQLGFTIRARNASWSPGYIQQNEARLGFVAGAIPGRMVLVGSEEGLPPLLVLSFDSQAALAEDPAFSAIRCMALHLDVAQVDRAEQAFERMRSCAVSMAQAMDGLITDDNGRALVVQSMDVIGTELQGLYGILEQRDLAAGSALARRLFS